MKTPEERAAEIVGPLERSKWPVDDGWPDIAKEIADAIREAVAEMTRFRDNAVRDLGDAMEALGRAGIHWRPQRGGE